MTEVRADDSAVQALKTWLADHEAALVADLQRLLRVPSLKDAPAPNAPYGAANREALDLMLALAAEHGMRVVDLDGHCGYAEFGEGEPLVMVLGHLDVVPVGPGWKHAPFGAEIDDGYLYARGAVDDKGPTMAAFYAALALKAHLPEDAGVRVRCVFGCDEESGFGCIARYNETEEAPTFGISPDADWPLVYAEKGISDLLVEAPRVQGDFELLSIVGGQRSNIVIDRCEARVRVKAAALAHVEAALEDAWDRNVSATWGEAEADGSRILNIEAVGKAAHGSVPYFGDNAATRALRFMSEIAPLSAQEAYIHLFTLPEHSGAGVGLAGADEVSGPLTCNLGIIETEGEVVRLTLNVRYPVTWTGAQVRERCEAALAGKPGGPWRLASMSDSEPLYFEREHPLVQTICAVHEAETGEARAPQVIGGGTYARAIANTVSVGTSWLGDGPAHENDERIKLDHLHKISRIYAHVLHRLVQLAPKQHRGSSS